MGIKPEFSYIGRHAWQRKIRKAMQWMLALIVLIPLLAVTGRMAYIGADSTLESYYLARYGLDHNRAVLTRQMCDIQQDVAPRFPSKPLKKDEIQ